MAIDVQDQLEDEEIVSAPPSPIVEAFQTWMREKGAWMATSLTAHAVILLSTWLILELLGYGVIREKKPLDVPTFEAVDAPAATEEIAKFELTKTSYDPTELTTESLTAENKEAAIEAKHFDDSGLPFEDSGGGVKSSANVMAGGLGGFNTSSMGAGGAITGMAGGIGGSDGFGKNGGSGGDGSGFGGRGQGSREAMLGTYGGTKNSERAVAAALNWIARHQSADGSWGIESFTKQCKGGQCGGAGNHKSDSAATALGLLPFLAAGQTHQSKGPYQTKINGAVQWLISHQKPDGDLSFGAGGNSRMYSHGLAAIALCECYGLSDDSRVRAAAQKAIKFIEDAQDKAGGGWRYELNQAGDTSVVGWQVMALKSGLMSGLTVKKETLDGVHSYLGSFKGKNNAYGGLFGYQPAGGPTPAMTGVGVLCSQYMGSQRGSPEITEGVKFIMGNQPDGGERNIYYWYYATQVMHNMLGPDWDTWNRKMRKLLIDTQIKDGGNACAVGSWDPDRPTKDHWSDAGGRLMVTSLSCLTLEVYYRYLPLYKLDKPAEANAKEAAK